MNVDPRRQVALKAIAHAGDLIAPSLEEAPPFGGVIEFRPLLLFERVCLPAAHLRHGKLEMLVHDRAKAGFNHHFLRGFRERL
jgi:hypothetical protein